MDSMAPTGTHGCSVNGIEEKDCAMLQPKKTGHLLSELSFRTLCQDLFRHAGGRSCLLHHAVSRLESILTPVCVGASFMMGDAQTCIDWICLVVGTTVGKRLSLAWLWVLWHGKMLEKHH